MKRLTLSFLVVALMGCFSSCTKEQTSLNTLHGTWKLTSQLDDDGTPVPAIPGCTIEALVTFFLCDDNDQDDCFTTTKTTSVCTNGGTTVTDVNSSDSQYAVYGKTQMIWGGTPYEIESISKKELKIHRTDEPKATSTYEKQK